MDSTNTKTNEDKTMTNAEKQAEDLAVDRRLAEHDVKGQMTWMHVAKDVFKAGRFTLEVEQEGGMWRWTLKENGLWDSEDWCNSNEDAKLFGMQALVEKMK